MILNGYNVSIIFIKHCSETPMNHEILLFRCIIILYSCRYYYYSTSEYQIAKYSIGINYMVMIICNNWWIINRNLNKSLWKKNARRPATH